MGPSGKIQIGIPIQTERRVWVRSVFGSLCLTGMDSTDLHPVAVPPKPMVGPA